MFFATSESSFNYCFKRHIKKTSSLVKKNSDINVVLEGHADERGTREYNLALVKEELTAKDYLMTYGISEK